jgi:hypothetical protein
MSKKVFLAGEVLRAADVNTYLTQSRNLLINSDFSVNQREVSSVTTNLTFVFDRWFMTFSGGSCTHSTQAFTVGSGPGDDFQPTNFARLVTASQSGAGDLAALVQKIEDVRTLSDQTVTVSFYAKAASGTPKIGVELSQQFGTGGSPSAQVNTAAGAVTISTAWARYSVTVDVPSITGKTIGTDINTSSLTLNLWVSAGSTFATRASSIGIQNGTFDIWGVQVEEGSSATPYQRQSASIEGELSACQRYYQRLQNYPLRGVVSAAGQPGRVGGPLLTPMRGAPALTFFGSPGLFDGAAVSALTSITVNYATRNSLEYDGAGSVAMTAGRACVAYNQGIANINGYIADAEI